MNRYGRFLVLLAVGCGFLAILYAQDESTSNKAKPQVDGDDVPQTAVAGAAAASDSRRDVATDSETPLLASADRIDRASLHEAMNTMARYLVRVTKENGSFRYRLNTDPSVKVSKSYNILRHEGTMYSLASYHLWRPDERIRTALLRSTEYLKTTSLGPVEGHDELLAIWSKPEINHGNSPVQAKLGATGLGLVALLSVEKIQPGETSLEDLRRLGQFLIFMQKEDGGFHSKYIPSENGRTDKWTSLYYPGEAALGLVMLYEKDPAPKWLESAAKAIGYLAKKRSGRRRVEADHWALIATSKLLPLYDRIDPPVPRDLIEQHGYQVCRSILAEKPPHAPHTLMNGCFGVDGRTTPTATRLEGLLAAVDFLPPEQSELHDEIEIAAAEGIVFLLRSRVTAGTFVGAMPRAIRRLPNRHPRITRSFNRRASEIRIDYVQHALSAMLDFDRLAYGTQQSRSTSE